MDGVAYEENNIIHLKWDNGEKESVSTTLFFNHKLEEIIKSGENTLFFMNFKLWGFSFIYKLKKSGYSDITMNALYNNVNKNPKAGEFIYTVAGRVNQWFNLKIKSKDDNGCLQVLTYENFVPIEKDMIIEDFCTDEMDIVDGMLKSVKMMKDIGCKQKTVSSCATSLWRQTFNKYDVTRLFPEPTEEEYEFLKSAHHGGWCYVNKTGKCGKGIVLDVNSLYPYVMDTCYLPVLKGQWFDGEPRDYLMKHDTKGFYVRFSCNFKLKEGKLPFIRIQNDIKYPSTKILENSDVVDYRTGEIYKEYVDEDGVIHPIKATLTLWKDEYKLFLEHYDVENIEYIGGYEYTCVKNNFKKYVRFFGNMKQNAKNKSEKRISKIMMNALSGNLAKNKLRESVYYSESAMDSIVGETNVAGRMDIAMQRNGKLIETKSRSRSYISIGAAITSIAMCITVRAAQANYKHFLYSDTDSLHLNCDVDEVVGLKIDDKELGAWKIEHKFSRGSYIQQKVYFIDDEKDGPIVKWSGMKNAQRKIVEEIIAKGEKVDNPKISIPYIVYEVNDLENFNKSEVKNYYKVDISDLI